MEPRVETRRQVSPLHLVIEMTFKDILTDRLCLRSLQLEDTENLYAYRSDPGVLEFQSLEAKSSDEIRSFINGMKLREFNAPGWYQIGIALRADDGLIGDCGIHVLEAEPRVVELGITIAPSFQSKGYATGALNAVIDLLFGKLAKHRVYTSVDPRNLPSMTLMKRLGLRKEGHFVQSLRFRNEWVDDVIFAMLCSEWQEKRTRI